MQMYDNKRPNFEVKSAMRKKTPVSIAIDDMRAYKEVRIKTNDRELLVFSYTNGGSRRPGRLRLSINGIKMVSPDIDSDGRSGPRIQVESLDGRITEGKSFEVVMDHTSVNYTAVAIELQA